MQESQALSHVSPTAKHAYETLKALVVRNSRPATVRELAALTGWTITPYSEMIELQDAGLIISSGMRTCSVSGRMMATWDVAKTIRVKTKREPRTYYIGLNEHGNVDRVYFDKPMSLRHFEIVEVSEVTAPYPIQDGQKDAQVDLANDRQGHDEGHRVRVPRARKKTKLS